MAEQTPKSLPHIDNATELAFERTRAGLQYKRVGALIGVLCFLVVASVSAQTFPNPAPPAQAATAPSTD
jgi:hypothetical protein